MATCTGIIPRTIFRSDTYSFPVTFKEDGVPINITDWEIRFTVRTSAPSTDTTDDSNAVISSLAVITDAINGEAQFTITPTETDIDPIEYVYDIQYKTEVGVTRTLGTSTFTVEADITRDS